ncbi:MarR family winged helix-turn-helix transcriptional regulator [Leifsonia poae]|uniref:MarR family winged helix-turn-helix transcriptional regulator n=1 Tax=Leifsonia poae TaxID=110933 RepID=UPI001CBB86FB|nr:MarR family transcriptional regulator [Leifsonia poae]
MVEDINAAAIATAIQNSVAVFTRHLRQLPPGGELAFTELLALSRLDQLGPSTASDLARAEHITPQGMGVTVAELERRGLLQRQGDPRDKRRVLLAMTENGMRALADRRDTRTDQITKVLIESFTSDELRALLTAAPLIERLGAGLLR